MWQVFTRILPTGQVGKDLAAVSPFVQQAMVLIGPGNANLKTLDEVLSAARKDPKVWSYGTSGAGSSQHLAGELLNTLAGTTLTHIPYKGGAQAVTDVIGGQVPLAMLGVTPVLAHAQSGKVRVYAVTTEHRIEGLPDVPTMVEAGVKGFVASQWYVVATSVGTPDDRIATLNNLITEIIASPELKSVLLASGSVPSKGSAKDALNFVTQENRRWKDLAQKSKLNLAP
jgi:tripartite-type tricarboxylate transporter receptor subunit TctC